jgi:hypothetical protein
MTAPDSSLTLFGHAMFRNHLRCLYSNIPAGMPRWSYKGYNGSCESCRQAAVGSAVRLWREGSAGPGRLDMIAYRWTANRILREERDVAVVDPPREGPRPRRNADEGKTSDAQRRG